MQGQIERELNAPRNGKPSLLAHGKKEDEKNEAFNEVCKQLLEVNSSIEELFEERFDHPGRWNGFVRDQKRLMRLVLHGTENIPGVRETCQNFLGENYEFAHPVHNGERITMNELSLSPADVAEPTNNQIVRDLTQQEGSWPSREEAMSSARRNARISRRSSRRSAEGPAQDVVEDVASVAGTGFGVFKDSRVATVGMIGLALSKSLTNDDIEPSQLEGNRRNISQALTDILLVGGMAAFIRLGMMALRGHNVFDFLFSDHLPE